MRRPYGALLIAVLVCAAALYYGVRCAVEDIFRPTE